MRQIILFLCVLFFLACNKDSGTYNPNITLSQRLITKVEGPVTIRANDTALITVYWPYSSGCDVLEKFEETKQGNIITIKAMGYRAEGICTMDAGIKTKDYKFSSSITGNYELRFINRDGTFISHSVTVN